MHGMDYERILALDKSAARQAKRSTSRMEDLSCTSARQNNAQCPAQRGAMGIPYAASNGGEVQLGALETTCVHTCGQQVHAGRTSTDHRLEQVCTS